MLGIHMIRRAGKAVCSSELKQLQNAIIGLFIRWDEFIGLCSLFLPEPWLYRMFANLQGRKITCFSNGAVNESDYFTFKFWLRTRYLYSVFFITKALLN